MARSHRIDRVNTVEILDGIPPFVKKRRRRGRKGIGLRYEAKVQKHFLDIYGYEYIPGPWLKYSLVKTPKVINYAQPDGLLIEPKRGTVTIVEIKYSHCAESYFQLMDKYLPLISKLFESPDSDTHLWEFPLVEVVKWYDKATNYPSKIRMRDDISKCSPREIGVHICRPDRK